ncbi:MAG: hypothetical protein HY820_31500 [Acidobacteria bacterium]|nr:hypothetical protein [Acidobacteriota bacterium]
MMTRSLMLTLLTFAGSATVEASSIVLVSTDLIAGITHYHYALRLDAGEFNQFNQGAELQLTGMAGVTGSSMGGILPACFDANFSTASSARLVQLDATGCGISNPNVTPSNIDDWTVRSSSTATGLVNYTIQAAQGPFTGQVQGPVADTGVPEPRTTGLIAAALLLAFRYRRSRVAGILLVMPCLLLASPKPAPVKLPTHFESLTENSYGLRGAGYSIELTPAQATWKIKGHTIHMNMAGGNPKAPIRGVDRSSGVSNYIAGKDRGRWVTGVPHYKSVRYDRVYPGIDAVFYQGGNGLEYDFLLSPHADPDRIALQFEGMSGLRLDLNGDLVIAASGLRHRKPIAYQTTGGKAIAVEVSFRLVSHSEVRFSLGSFDRSAPLTIDPGVSFATVFPTSGGDTATGVSYSGGSVNSPGDIFIIGHTNSNDFPVTPNAFQTQSGSGSFNTFVVRMTMGGTIVYSTYLGGTTPYASYDLGAAISADSSGAACVTGLTTSADFPVTPGAFQSQPMFQNGYDAYVVKFAANGIPIYSTYLGGSGVDSGTAVAIRNGHCWVGGTTGSYDFPTKLYTGVMNQCTGSGCTGSTNVTDGFLSRFDETGDLIYSRFIGSNSTDTIDAIAVTADMKIYVAGSTFDFFGNFPLRNAFRTKAVGLDGFITRLEFPNYYPIPGITYSTFVGGSGDEGIKSLVVDSQGNMYGGGTTRSQNLAASLNSFGGASDGFVVKVNASGALAYSRYAGGTDDDELKSIALTTDGGLILTGWTRSPNVNGWGPPVLKGVLDAFLFKLTAPGAYEWATHVGGSQGDAALGIAAAPPTFSTSRRFIMVGSTSSPDFQTTTGIHPSGPNSDAFVSIWTY